jgi:hypothetical protein
MRGTTFSDNDVSLAQATGAGSAPRLGHVGDRLVFGTENLHYVDRNFDGVAREAVLPIPFAAAQPAFDVGQLAADLAALELCDPDPGFT